MKNFLGVLSLLTGLVGHDAAHSLDFDPVAELPPVVVRYTLINYYIFTDVSYSYTGSCITKIVMNRDEYEEYNSQYAANRFTPSCLRERDFLAFVRSQAESGHDMNTGQWYLGFGSGLPADITRFIGSAYGGVADPLYQDPSWRKMEITFEYYDQNVKSPVKLQAHYWWNRATFQTDQLKLKNSVLEGCMGQIVKIG